jgi:transposase InsO family protein
VTLHSDQGSTYATGSYREIVNRYGIRGEHESQR